uniref:Uncharacterized protein n=1 Tax=Anguilla anguilla TaxID=7936 RepID=A0A0E9Q985_ANGAN
MGISNFWLSGVSFLFASSLLLFRFCLLALTGLGCCGI